MASGAAILVLEDESDLAFLLSQNLEQQGHSVTCCETVAAARSALATSPADLLLLDVNLPDGTGFELLGELRKQGVWTPAVFLNNRRVDKSILRLQGFWNRQVESLKNTRTQAGQVWGAADTAGSAEGVASSR